MRRISSALTLSLLLGACGGGGARTETTPEDNAPGQSEADVGPPGTAPDKPAEPAKPAIPDAPTAAPSIFKVLHEDDNVRVLDVLWPAGEKVPMHQGATSVEYVLKGGKIKVSMAESEAHEVTLKAASAIYSPAGVGEAENTGKTEIKAILVELKKPSYAAAPAGKDPLKVGGKTYKKVFADEHVRVLEANFKKAATVPAHSFADHVAYALTPGTLNITPADGGARDAEFTAGKAVFAPAGVISIKNTGKTGLKIIVFELGAPTSGKEEKPAKAEKK